LKPDENVTLRLSGAAPPRPGAFARFWGAVTQSTADADLANTLQTFGYQTASCKALVGTVDDLKEPLSDSFLSGLDFGNSRFLFVVGVEDRSTTHLTKSNKFVPGGLGEAGWVVLSGYLFDKQAPGRLVWRNRVIGVDQSGMELLGPEAAAKTYIGEVAIRNGESALLSSFMSRGAKAIQPSKSETREAKWEAIQGGRLHTAETFAVPCDSLWSTIKETLGDSKHFEIVASFDSDRMVFFSRGRRGQEALRIIDYLNLTPAANGCTEHFVQPPHMAANHTTGYFKDASDLNKLLHIPLSK
jgi:hypothetical protein